VFVGHAAEIFGWALPDIVAHSAKEGVAVFFVLSGYVIAFVVDRKERDWRTYAVARALRMYSVVPLAIFVLLACYGIGVSLAPHSYAPGMEAAPGITTNFVGSAPNAWSIVRYLTFTNEIWFDRSVISTGAPFWSLAFEVSYYVLFALVVFGRGWWRWIFVASWLLIVGPRIALALPLWMVGVAAYYAQARLTGLGQAPARLLLALVLLTMLAVRRVAGALAFPMFEWASISDQMGSSAYYLILGVLIGATILLFDRCFGDDSVWPDALAKAVRYFAGASFTLYLVHLPLLSLASVAVPATRQSIGASILAALLTFVGSLALSELGERRKKFYKRLLVELPISMVNYMKQLLYLRLKSINRTH